MVKRLLHEGTLTKDLLQFFSRRESEIELESLRKNWILNLHFKFFYHLRISWVLTVEQHEDCTNVSKIQSLSKVFPVVEFQNFVTTDLFFASTETKN